MKYKVVRDRQDTGWAFDLGALSAKTWLENARYWAWVDDNTDIDNELEWLERNNASDEEILALIDEIWDIEFAPVLEISVSGESTTTPVKVNVLKAEFSREKSLLT